MGDHPVRRGLIFAVDPGPEESAYVLYCRQRKRLRDFAHLPNKTIQARIMPMCWGDDMPAELVIESLVSYGMPVGASTFQTGFWIGRFDPWEQATLIDRIAVKTTLCRSARAKDANVRQALIDRFGGEKAVKAPRCPACNGKGWRGRGRPECEECKGSGAHPDPWVGCLYGVSGHVWSALALAVVHDIATGGEL